MVKNLLFGASVVGSIPGSGRSLEKEMALTPVFLPGKFMDRGVWQAKVHGVTKSGARLTMYVMYVLY